MRLFIALMLGEKAAKELQSLSQELKRQGRGSFPPEENLHLTLAFLGETEPDMLPAIRQAMDEAGFAEMTLTFGKTGRFRQREGDTVWAGIEENSALSSLQRRLRQAFLPGG